MPHSPALDGIRGIAIVAVLIFHVLPQHLPGGFAGVDVFFVLSGFLLTRRILSEVRHGTFQMGTFFLRRAMRILPNLTLMVVSVVILWAWIFPPGASRDVAVQGLWTLSGIPNFYLWTHLGTYWGQAAHWSPLTHAWSLGVEEQFYALLPLFIVAIQRWQPKDLTGWILALATLSLVVWWLGMSGYPTATFYLLPTRAWELLLGCLIASFQHSAPGGGHRLAESWCSAAGWVGLALALSAFAFHIDRGVGSSLNPIPAALGCGLLLVHATHPTVGGSRLGRLLSGRGLPVIGRLSYSLYLWHWPLLTLGGYFADRWNWDPSFGRAAGTLISLGPAWMAYRCVESPCRRSGALRLAKPALVAAALGTAALTCGWMTQIRPRDPANLIDPPHYSARAYDAGILFSEDISQSPRYRGMKTPPAPDRPRDSWRSGGIIHQHGGTNPSVVVLGSSHALMYSAMIDNVCAEMGLTVAFLCADGGASPFFDNRQGHSFASDSIASQFDRVRLGWIQAWRPEILIVSDRWDGHASGPAAFDRKLRAFLREVAPYSRHQILVAQVPVLAGIRDINLLELVHWGSSPSRTPSVLMADRKQDLRDRFAEAMENAADEFRGLRVIRPDLSLLLTDRQVHYLCNRTLLYIDEGHLSDEGAEHLRPLFLEAMTEAIGDSRGMIPRSVRLPKDRAIHGPHSSQERSCTTNWSRPR